MQVARRLVTLTDRSGLAAPCIVSDTYSPALVIIHNEESGEAIHTRAYRRCPEDRPKYFNREGRAPLRSLVSTPKLAPVGADDPTLAGQKEVARARARDHFAQEDLTGRNGPKIDAYHSPRGLISGATRNSQGGGGRAVRACEASHGGQSRILPESQAATENSAGTSRGHTHTYTRKSIYIGLTGAGRATGIEIGFRRLQGSEGRGWRRCSVFAWVSRLHPPAHTLPPPTGQGTRKEQLEGLQGREGGGGEALVRVNFQGCRGRSLSAGFSDPG